MSRKNESDTAPALGRVAVIGSGAVGAYYGGRLAQAGQDVHFHVRRDLEIWRRRGLVVRSVAGDFTIDPVHAYADTAEIGPCDLVILALKSTANAVVPELVAPLLHDRTRLLTLQNGLGNDEFLADHFGAARVLGGLCFVCINRAEDGVIHHLGQGAVVLGNFRRGEDDTLRAIAAAFKAAGVPASTTGDLGAAQWRKLVWNIPFNGLAVACGGIDCAAILADPEREQRVRALMAEVIATAAAFGHHLPPDLIDRQVALTRDMGAYRPSTLIDFLAGNPLELEAIWGEPLRRARQAGLPVPALQQLAAELRTVCGAAAPDQGARRPSAAIE